MHYINEEHLIAKFIYFLAILYVRSDLHVLPTNHQSIKISTAPFRRVILNLYTCVILPMLLISILDCLY